jgi:hypothetical protein
MVPSSSISIRYRIKRSIRRQRVHNYRCHKIAAGFSNNFHGSCKAYHQVKAQAETDAQALLVCKCSQPLSVRMGSRSFPVLYFINSMVKPSVDDSSSTITALVISLTSALLYRLVAGLNKPFWVWCKKRIFRQ